MNTSNRRTFIQQTATAVAATALALSARARAAGANERVIMAVIGPGGMGSNLLSSFAAQKDVGVATNRAIR